MRKHNDRQNPQAHEWLSWQIRSQVGGLYL